MDKWSDQFVHLLGVILFYDLITAAVLLGGHTSLNTRKKLYFWQVVCPYFLLFIYISSS